MSSMDINQVLVQMRAMEASAKSQISKPISNELTSTAGVAGLDAGVDKAQFSDVMKQAVNKVNEAQSTAAQLSTDYVAGSEKVDLPEVMIAVQEASISFQAITQVRNRLLSAYQDVMNMPL